MTRKIRLVFFSGYLRSSVGLIDAPVHSIVLENISHTFLKPNILDIKLGRVLYDRHASEEKRARMEKTARETTSWETGVRLTGFQVRLYQRMCMNDLKC